MLSCLFVTVGTIFSQPPIKDGNANSDISGAGLQNDDESTVPVGSDAKGHNASFKDGPESTNASVSLNLSSQCEKTPSLIISHNNLRFL